MAASESPTFQRVVLKLSGESFTRAGERGISTARSQVFDLVLLDLMLPGMDGLEVCRALRGDPATARIPIIMVTARGEESDKVAGPEVGADDYITKPFSPRELVARLRALLRRAQPSRAEGVIEAGDLRIDTLAREATYRGRKLSLTPREFELLAFLAHRPGRVMSREELLRKVWGYDYLGETRTVDVHVRRLRVKLGERHRLIETVTGAGYKFTAGSTAAT